MLQRERKRVKPLLFTEKRRIKPKHLKHSLSVADAIKELHSKSFLSNFWGAVQCQLVHEDLFAAISSQHPNHFFLFFQVIAHQCYRHFITGL